MGHLIIPQTGVQLFRGEVFISSASKASTTTSAIITLNVAAQSVAVVSSAGFAVNDIVSVDSGAGYEATVITAIADATHVTAIFAVNHASGVTISKGYQNVPMGVCQEFTFDDTIDLKEMRGPRSRLAIAVAQSGAKISGSCKFGSTNAQILAVTRGANLSTVTLPGGGIATKAARKGSDNVKPVIIELFDVDNEAGPHALFYNVIFTDIKNPQKLDDYTMWDAPFNCYPETVTQSIYDIYYPGDQTQPYALPANTQGGTYTNDAGFTTAQTDYATTSLTVGHNE